LVGVFGIGIKIDDSIDKKLIERREGRAAGLIAA
jgi:hypothetical protein